MRSLLGNARAQLWRRWFWVVVHTRPSSRILQHYQEWAERVGAVETLRALGARVGNGVKIEPWLKIQNADRGRCDHLAIGDGTYLGPDVLIDLADEVEIGAKAAIAGRVSILTHQDVGRRPLQAVMPRKTGRVKIEEGSFLGFGSTICHGVTVHEFGVVGAGALVREDVPTRSIMVGVPGRVIKTFEFEPDS